MWIRNTLTLDRFYISEALLEEAAQDPKLKLLGAPEPLPFDAEGYTARSCWNAINDMGGR